MLSCIYDGKIFTTKQEGYTTEDKYNLGRRGQLLCPVCKTSVYFCEEGEKIAHFNHHKLGDCPMGIYRSYDYSTTVKHDNLVCKFVDWVKAQFPDVNVYPDYYINNELFTDIYFELGDYKIAIEIQFKKFSNPTFIKRRDLYRKYKINDIWFFIQEDMNFSIGSPYQRTYYRSNKRELYFYAIKEEVCKVYKGFTGEKWDIVGKNTLLNYISVEVPLEKIKINSGAIIVPELKSEYFQNIKNRREINKKKRETQRQYREQQQHVTKNSDPNYNSHSSFVDKQFMGIKRNVYEKQTKNNIHEVSLLDRVRHYMKVEQDKSILYEYKRYHFKIEKNIEYLYITIVYQSKEYDVRYIILNKQVEKNEKYLICRKEDDPENIRYSISINPFLDSINKIRIQKQKLKD
ncbi:UNVERIFIED_CONTAM: hypothetical protein Cloal_2347 [Acetivibrio alkalicellulosi]